MKILKFTLSGKTAFFKKPDVNTYLYFTYGNIHKVALLGILGAILGYGGYNQMKKLDTSKGSNKKDNEYIVFPEFYEKLKNIKISIVPNNEKGFIPKKVQTFNNSVGYASKEQGGNLIIKEQWLENPSWDIYVLVDNKESEKIAEYLLNHKAVYQPYLGKNDHYASIKDAEIIDDNRITELNEIRKINSLFPKRFFEVNLEEDEEEDDECLDDVYEDAFKYEEKLPIALDKDTNMYILEGFLYTNMKVSGHNDIIVYKVGKRNIIFY
ncbi:type I-B CRISPR-associated protein Cas5b [Clostridium beijerinckii]|uniref:Type I-B CRISPR-associated protein Cas5 n=1 Tax=Clostridium beijerinckii TaxID=1520 RepID=A0A1S9N4T9_CLOBE|nr:type I-B CRISPR-associated protein Cas5b [Clostridium beijerinckii]MZK52847.1 type I-B CRISPR-associated protein Cas5 [Clostridium beijerinckii]MZK60948.1 type I-B CRISPR-associated protein Cas5 [Clostridium beijerinckii]MZK71154.1 type I-B CRISPR-associated protein Cas5 [Clostridium beijerinckii]MZK76512.1 type I-B CRISPR-associated protein Cas5 [Clostridium beijerinckii]MZK86181.1 type I-B CRISPR-associated protein Cas5 [Clostridium beijerinckii]